MLIASEWEVRRRGVERVVVVVLRRVGRSGCGAVAASPADVGLISEGSDTGGCWFAKARSSSAALVCQWKAVRESRARKDSGRRVDWWEPRRKYSGRDCRVAWRQVRDCGRKMWT